jgi:dipeptidyl-peptidase-4
MTILVQNRSQTEQVLLRVDTITGETRELLRERDSAWINLGPSPHWVDDGNAFYWATEQAPPGSSADNWALERRDAQGDLLLASSPACAMRGLTKTIEEGSRIFVTAHPDPTQTSVFTMAVQQSSDGTCVVGDGQDLASLIPAPAPGPGQHTFTLSEDATHAVHSWSMLTGEVGWRVERYERDYSKGQIVGGLTSMSESPELTPRVELVTLEGERAIRCAVIRPRDFDSKKTYPVIDFAYAGPHSKTVHAASRPYLLHQWFADQGFIVVCIDGRGTPDRGRAWERAIRHNLIDAALEDHCDALKALCDKFPEMDRSRIGVSGWSFGGYYAAMAVMRRPDVYKAGVAGAPVADWRDYDTHYTERYMGMPVEPGVLTDGVPGNEPGYDASSALTYADRLSVPLLIIHGTADDNVYVVHSYKLVDALNRAGRAYEFLPLPGQTHAVSKPEQVRAVQARAAKFLREHLLR